jgi:hypothetical protein
MQSPARVVGLRGDTNGTFDAKCIEHRRASLLTSPSMEGNGADRPQSAVRQGLGPPAADPAGLHGGGRRTRLGCNTGGRQLIAEPLGGAKRRDANGASIPIRCEPILSHVA